MRSLTQWIRKTPRIAFLAIAAASAASVYLVHKSVPPPESDAVLAERKKMAEITAKLNADPEIRKLEKRIYYSEHVRIEMESDWKGRDSAVKMEDTLRFELWQRARIPLFKTYESVFRQKVEALDPGMIQWRERDLARRKATLAAAAVFWGGSDFGALSDPVSDLQSDRVQETKVIYEAYRAKVDVLDRERDEKILKAGQQYWKESKIRSVASREVEQQEAEKKANDIFVSARKVYQLQENIDVLNVDIVYSKRRHRLFKEEATRDDSFKERALGSEKQVEKEELKLKVLEEELRKLTGERP